MPCLQVAAGGRARRQQIRCPGATAQMTSKLLVPTMIASLMLAMAAGPAAAQQPVRKDFQTFQDATREVRRYVNYTIFDHVAMNVKNGVVTLTGKVTMPFKRSDIEKRVARVLGVLAVDNQIEVLPQSMFDNELRYLTARRIYGNPSFSRYASMVNPPIHIVVENGRVTLTGVVQSPVDRMLAQSLTVGVGAFSVTNELKTDEEMRTLLESIA